VRGKPKFDAKRFMDAIQAAAILSYADFAAKLGKSISDRRCENLFFAARDLAKIATEFKPEELAAILKEV
jgi:hypothetical protein